MKTYKFSTLVIVIFTSLLFVQCGNDDDTTGDPVLDFTGTYTQQDIMGRPGINTVFGANSESKNAYNVSLTSNRAAYAGPFTDMLQAYHAAYGTSYETNILGFDAATLGAVLATTDALQVAPEGATAYFIPGAVALTGRRLNDDVIDVSLTLMFGGSTGTRFDGNNGTPQLTSDGVGFGDRVIGSFPYLETPNN